MGKEWTRLVKGELVRYVPSTRERVWDLVLDLVDRRVMGDSYEKEVSDKLSPYLSDIVEEIEGLAQQVEQEEIDEINRKLEQEREG